MTFKKQSSLIFLFISLLLITSAYTSATEPETQSHQQVPSTMDPVYPTTPNWVSSNPHYSTGAALADFNKDGWLDLVVADGNDMAVGKINVYLNNDGYLPTTPNWQSADLAYNGHLDVADVNGDGWPDVAVSHLGTGSTTNQPIARLYLNNNGILSSNPDWVAPINGNAFGVDFGDMNNDGRPDLAVATGWSYSPQHNYHNYVYLNNNGILESTATWFSSDINNYQGALWIDADEDGWLDLAFLGTGQETQIYRNLGGILETTASWHTTDSSSQDGIMLAAGDVTLDGIRDLFATDNTQLGGSGRFKQYTGLSSGFFSSTYSWNYYDGYGSAVALADVNFDGNLDLATGAWWDNTRLFFNTGAGLPTSPSWNSALTTVVEKIVFGNIGPYENEQNYTEVFPSAGNRKLFYLPHQQIQTITSVTRDGTSLTPAQYTYSREDGWITVNSPPTQSLQVVYTYSSSLDMVVTNWDPSIGNHMYYNQQGNITLPDLDASGTLRWSELKPGSTVSGTIKVTNIGDIGSLLNWEIQSYPEWGTWTFVPSSGLELPDGSSTTIQVTVSAPNEMNSEYWGNITIINIDNPSDFCTIETHLTTPHSQLTQTTPALMQYNNRILGFHLKQAFNQQVHNENSFQFIRFINRFLTNLNH